MAGAAPKFSPQVGRAADSALSANIKANTFVLALVAAGLVAVDEWLFADDGDFKAGLPPRTGFSVACFAAPMAIYYLWNVRYVGWLVSRSASDSGVGETSAPLSAVVVNGIKILLGQPVEAFTPSVRPSSALRWPTWATNSGRVTAS